MGAYTATPIEVVKYLKFPDRKLVSGFLTINCVSHNDNDAFDDAQQEYYDNWDSSISPSDNANSLQNSTPFEGTRPDDPSRAAYKHTFGDFDCLLFWVAGGMTIQTPTNVGSTQNVSGYLYDDGNWYTSVLHPCQHFMKSHLIGRINNGYGFNVTDYSKVSPIRQDTFELDDATTLKSDETGVPTAYAANRGGQWSRYIISNGIFSADTDGDWKVDLSVDTNNTYFPMIEGVEIYGKHNYSIPFNTKSANPTLYSISPGGSYDGDAYVHQDNFWSMVIKIKYRGYKSDQHTAGGTQADKEFFQSRTNVMFQPFGETASFDFADSLHTS
tara:strand:+ start:772 stop:1755 length:984 start_codon:yes stop_codon:yes gene_type:complete